MAGKLEGGVRRIELCVGRRGDVSLSTQKVAEAVPGVRAEQKSRGARQ